jgi:RNA polymerase sigma-70 factor (ECF subfamily)
MQPVNLDRNELTRLRSQDEEAWADLHREHFPRLWCSVNRILNNPSHADDVVQEAFVKAFREVDRFQGQSQIGTWLYRIAVNQALDFVRKRQRRERWLSFLSPFRDPGDDGALPALPDRPVPAESSSELERADLREHLFAAMAELSPEHRAVVQLRLVEEHSLAETSEILGCKEGTVNSRLHYACEHLRRKLKARIPKDDWL